MTPHGLGCVSSCSGARLAALPACCSSAAQDPGSGRMEPCRCFGAVMPSAAGSSVPGAAAGSHSGTRALSQNPALGLLWGTRMDVCGSRQGRRARAEPCCLQITLALPVLQPPSRWKCRGWESYLSLSQLLQFLVQ